MRIGSETVAVVTGAGSGIGRALAQALDRAGARLALADVNGAGLAETVKGMDGDRVSTHVVDVSDRERWQSFADEVIEAHGRASLLINNAGVALHGRVEEVSIEEIEWLLGINFFGTVYGVKTFLPHLRREKSAHIVNISSIFGIIAPAGQAAYAASKFAVRGFTESLRHELEGSPIRVTVVHPGGIKTSIARNARMGEHADQGEAKRVKEKFEQIAETTPEEAARCILSGVERDAPRILIGSDARRLALMQKLMPVKYWRMVEPMFERMLNK